VRWVSGCSCTSRRFSNPWGWSWHRWRHLCSRVHSVVPKTTRSSCLPCPTHTSPDRSSPSSTFWMTQLEQHPVLLISRSLWHRSAEVAAAAASLKLTSYSSFSAYLFNSWTRMRCAKTTGTEWPILILPWRPWMRSSWTVLNLEDA